ncbi:MAG TPA: hypothetical protein PKH91_05370 [Flavobacterium sp.]|jgi:hypothetical protein|nr:hypothetical protein [Flavobacterium sp.]
MLNFKAPDNQFEDIGSLKEFCEKYGDCKITFEDIKDSNITLNIISNQEVEFKFLCSRTLSEIIRENKSLPDNIREYRILRINCDSGISYIRVSQSIKIEGDYSLSVAENMEKLKDVYGNVSVWFSVDKIKSES